MSKSLNLQNISSLTDLQNSLSRFAIAAQEILRTTQNEINRTMTWLSERINHWQGEVERAKHTVTQAETNLRRCKANSSRDERNRHSECSAEEEALAAAIAHLRICQVNLQTAKIWQSRVEQASAEYQRQAHRLETLTTSHAEKTRVFLNQTAAKYTQVQDAEMVVGGGNMNFGIRSNSSQKGSNFENILRKDYFLEEAKRLTIFPEDNIEIDKDFALFKGYRIIDAYWEESKSIWEFKSGYEKGNINIDQASDYDEIYELAQKHGYLYARDGDTKVKIPVNSINYVFETKEGAEANRYSVADYAVLWYLDKKGHLQLLEE
jgi:hypothetical protein